MVTAARRDIRTSPSSSLLASSGTLSFSYTHRTCVCSYVYTCIIEAITQHNVYNMMYPCVPAQRSRPLRLPFWQCSVFPAQRFDQQSETRAPPPGVFLDSVPHVLCGSILLLRSEASMTVTCTVNHRQASQVGKTVGPRSRLASSRGRLTGGDGGRVCSEFHGPSASLS